jgi:hypothetical protein
MLDKKRGQECTRKQGFKNKSFPVHFHPTADFISCKLPGVAVGEFLNFESIPFSLIRLL